MINCPICNSEARFFVKKKDRFNQEYEYFRCDRCKFLFDKELIINKDNLQKKVNNIYQEDYFQKIDKGWQMRGDKISKIINNFLKIYRTVKIFKKNISVLDYGGGRGYITSKINNNFNVFYYDRYVKPDYSGNYKVLDKPQKVDIVCVIEVVEHITDLEEWSFINQLSSDVLIFTTEPSDGINDKELVGWWYIKPDAGHTSIYSLFSLYLLAKKYGFVYLFFPSKFFHIFIRNHFLSQFNFVKLEYFFYNFFRRIKHIKYESVF